MKITAITRYKHGEIYAILQRLGWSQSELARRTGLSATTIGDIINLVKRPKVEQADAIQKTLGTAGEYLDVLSEWPETFEGLKRGFRREQTAEVPMERLLDHPEVLQLAAPGTEEETGLEERLETIIGELPRQQQVVLRERFWNGKTLEATGKNTNLGLTRDRVRQIEAAALRKLRHPERIKRLAPELCGVES